MNINNEIYKDNKWECWDKLELCKGLKGNLNENIAKLYQYNRNHDK